jgi:hypothetical protein
MPIILVSDCIHESHHANFTKRQQGKAAVHHHHQFWALNLGTDTTSLHGVTLIHIF